MATATHVLAGCSVGDSLGSGVDADQDRIGQPIKHHQQQTQHPAADDDERQNGDNDLHHR
ncbi:hypothetical protein [Geodermatophilus sp. DSM 45219]|uniref:hypothetical protein n=1 Tax=Geodermatophilus sp. DSM 45219 TaxID=1881103 RepID=UPI00115FCF39|nr:hypothetical protein [Geodermatophilus sp. DSM 45219]